MTRWWASRGERERMILLGGAALAALLLIYGLLWLPLAKSRDSLRAQWLQGERDLAWMQQVPVSALRSVPRVDSGRAGESLLARLDREAREAGLGGALLAVEPVADGEVRMRFQQVDFDVAVRWLQAQSAAGIQVRELSVQRSDVDGRSDLRVALGDATGSR